LSTVCLLKERLTPTQITYETSHLILYFNQFNCNKLNIKLDIKAEKLLVYKTFK